MRDCKAVITVATGRSGTRQFPVKRVEQYTTTESIDGDADQFSVTIGDSANQLDLCLDRDNEVRVQLYLDDLKGKMTPIFSGIADAPQRTEDMTLTIAGRDTPSSLAVDSDALPGRWKHVDPHSFIEARARKLGISNISIAKMSRINSLYTDGSEKEWALWYRIARMRGMYMWTNQVGGLVIDKLGYSLKATYKFGNGPGSGWMRPEAVTQISNKQGRTRRVIMYGQEAAKKTGKSMVAQGVDTSISSWRKKPTTILTSTTAKNQAELKADADLEVFETIVGAQEIELTVQDTGILIQQNTMALVNLPDLGIKNETMFVVGVQRQGGASGFVQIVRLREKGFALSKRVPDSPALAMAAGDTTGKSAGSLASALAAIPGIKWADSFVRATNEFGVPAGWDFAVFLGVLLAICDQETGGSFNNCRQGNGDVNWQPFAQWVESGAQLTSSKSEALLEVQWKQAFGNAKGNPFNPIKGSEAGVGPMQLTTLGYKQWADEYGWNGVAKKDEYAGGRWNPDSNIRAAARALVGKLQANPPADPTNPDSIWIGVARYNGGGASAAAYAASVKAKYKNTYSGEVQTAIASVKPIPPGSTNTSMQIPGYGVLSLPKTTPDEVRKAINFCLNRYGDPYEWGGAGPNYDCSSLVTAALASAAQYLRQMLDVPVQNPKHHGDTTYTLYKKGKTVSKDMLLPGDLVFFRGNPPEHVGMYLGDNLFIQDSRPGVPVNVASITEAYYADNYTGARRFAQWPTGGTAVSTKGAKKVMIQAGHDPGSNADQPYGHTGESGAPGEVSFTISVRDNVLARLQGDPAFNPIKGTAWSASAGATSLTADDIDFDGDLFLAIHYDADTAGGSRYFFGWPTGHGAGVLAASQSLRDKFITEYENISGHPTRNAGLDNSNAALYGYYAWGDASRASPDNIDHTKNASARLLIECGEGGTPSGADHAWLVGHVPAIGRAIYRAICAYYGLKPVGA